MENLLKNEAHIAHAREVPRTPCNTGLQSVAYRISKSFTIITCASDIRKNRISRDVNNAIIRLYKLSVGEYFKYLKIYKGSSAPTSCSYINEI